MRDGSTTMSVRWTRRRTHLLVAFLLSVTLYIFCGSLTPTLPSPRPRASTDLPPARSSVSSHGTSVPKPPTLTPTKYGDGAVEMVVASMKRENITWLHNYLLDWKKNIYVVDDSTAELTVPQNKGREAMVFLTYIINRYDSLPGNIFFHHAERFQWHNDNPDYDALTLLQRFRLQYLKEQGYANLRCDWALGCPSAIKPFVDKTEPEPGEGITAKHVYKESFEELFPGKEVPQTVAVPCCSQFAVRRETVRKRPKADYIRYRQWLIESDLDDGLSGRVLEYAWHIIFGKDAVHCPNAGACYCRMYGICDLRCDETHCKGQYTLPKYATLPQGWPKLGWDKEDRNWTGQE